MFQINGWERQSGGSRGWQEAQVLYFLHIPKTAGISLKSLLADHYHQREILPPALPIDLFHYSPVQLLDYELAMGHFTHAFVSYAAKPCDVVTFLRRPLDQAVSFFHDLKANGSLAAELSLSEVVESVEVQRLINLQTRWLASDDIATGNLGYNFHYSEMEPALEELQDRRLLECAKQRLSRMRFVGLVERFSESCELMAEEFGWPKQARVPHLNARPRRRMSEADEASLEKLGRLLQLDEELYRFACELYEQRRAELATRESGLRYRYLLATQPRKSHVQVTFDQPLWGTGWQEREQLADGTFARWTGPGGLATLDIPVATSNALQVSFLITATIAPENVDGLAVYANGSALELRRYFSTAGSYENILCLADVPVEALSDEETALHLELRVPHPVRPCDVDPLNGDDREIGIMLNWVAVTPHPAGVQPGL